MSCDFDGLVFYVAGFLHGVCGVGIAWCVYIYMTAGR